MSPIYLLSSLALAVSVMACDTGDPSDGDTEDVSVAPIDTCAQHRDCDEHGLCTLINGKCQASGPDDCLDSLWCRANGYCTYTYGTCSVDEAGCQQSETCTKYGERCHYCSTYLTCC